MLILMLQWPLQFLRLLSTVAQPSFGACRFSSTGGIGLALLELLKGAAEARANKLG